MASIIKYIEKVVELDKTRILMTTALPLVIDTHQTHVIYVGTLTMNCTRCVFDTPVALGYNNR